ncbi:hypothetical protein CJ20_161 [Escherichia phage CJ20]|nr:hypothetical protein CJ20_161 [Escherichia phage CJ20]
MSFFSALPSSLPSSSSSLGSSPSIMMERAISILRSSIKLPHTGPMFSAKYLRTATRSFDLMASNKSSIRNPLLLLQGFGNEPLWTPIQFA